METTDETEQAVVRKCRNPGRSFHSCDITEVWTRLACIIGHGFVGLKPFFFWKLNLLYI